jgi:hypothetical protein
VVADVVEHGREAVHVVAVERGHEGVVEEVDDLVGEPVPLVLGVADRLEQLAALGPALEEAPRADWRSRRRSAAAVKRSKKACFCGVSLGSRTIGPLLPNCHRSDTYYVSAK